MRMHATETRFQCRSRMNGTTRLKHITLLIRDRLKIGGFRRPRSADDCPQGTTGAASRRPRSGAWAGAVARRVGRFVLPRSTRSHVCHPFGWQTVAVLYAH